jgi:hypothetical protein
LSRSSSVLLQRPKAGIAAAAHIGQAAFAVNGNARRTL